MSSRPIPISRHLMISHAILSHWIGLLPNLFKKTTTPEILSMGSKHLELIPQHLIQGTWRPPWLLFLFFTFSLLHRKKGPHKRTGVPSFCFSFDFFSAEKIPQEWAWLTAGFSVILPLPTCTSQRIMMAIPTAKTGQKKMCTLRRQGPLMLGPKPG